MRHHRRIALAGLAAGIAVALGACGSDGSSSPDASTPEAAARSYAEAYLHGSADEYLSLWSSTCDQPDEEIDPEQWEAVQEQLGAGLGTPTEDIEVTGAEVRNRTGSSAEAAATFDLPEREAGNANWIPFVEEDGAWRVEDCTRSPIGGFSNPGS